MRLWRYCAAGLLFDWLVYVAWTVIPIRAVEFQASRTELGLLQTASTVVYALSSIFAGRLADRFSKSLIASLGCAGAIGCCFAIGRVEALAGLFLVVPLFGFSSSFFWPSIQGAIGAETDPSRMERAIGLFNVLWSVGKSLGFVAAGWMMGGLGAEQTLWAAVAAGGAILLFYPRQDGPRFTSPLAEDTNRRDREAFRMMGYIANFCAFGVSSVLINQYYKYLVDHGLGASLGPKRFIGLFLGIVYAAQTAAFLWTGSTARWTYRRAPLYASQVPLAAGAIAVPFLRADEAILAASLPVGLGLGFAYASSIYYSLHGPAGHGKYSGIHEAVLGAGNAVLPLAGGALADVMGEARFPFWLAGGAVLAAVAAQEALYRTRSGS
jgi:MFS family permease